MGATAQQGALRTAARLCIMSALMHAALDEFASFAATCRFSVQSAEHQQRLYPCHSYVEGWHRSKTFRPPAIGWPSIYAAMTKKRKQQLQSRLRLCSRAKRVLRMRRLQTSAKCARHFVG